MTYPRLAAGLSLLLACGPVQGGEDTGDATTGEPGESASGAPTTGDTPTGPGPGPGPGPGSDSSGDVPPDPTTDPEPTCPEGQPGALLAVTLLTDPAGMVWAPSIALGPDGEAYLTGALWEGDTSRPSLVRVARDGALLGLHEHQDIGAEGFSVGVVRASDGELLIAGHRGGAAREPFVASFAADGAPIGLSPFPGESGRRILGLGINSGDQLIVTTRDDQQVVWMMAISPAGDVAWEVSTSKIGGGPSWLAVAPNDQVAAAHGEWNAASDEHAQIVFLDEIGDQGWGKSIDAVPGEIGRMGGVAFNADLDVLGAANRLVPPGQIELYALATPNTNVLWRSVIADEPGALLLAQGLWVTPGGDIQVLVTRSAPAVAPTEVSARVLTVAPDGALKSTLELALGLTPAANPASEMRPAIDDCGALRIWDSASRTLWSVQL